MTNEKRKILNKVYEQIDRRKKELLSLIPDIHEIEDGFIIRSINDWKNRNNDAIKYKKIPNINKSEEIVVLFYLPKGTIFEMKRENYINFITCLSGSVEIDVNNKIVFLDSYGKVFLDHKEFCGRVIRNTYLITTNRI